MGDREYLQVDPATLHLPGSRLDGVDPVKLHRQLTIYGLTFEGMPPPEVKRGSDGELVIFDGVTRAAKFSPGMTITIEITGEISYPVGRLPMVGERL